MGALAIPELVAAGKALLITLGVIGGTAAVHEGSKAISEKIKESEKAKAQPIARTEPIAHAKTQCACPPEHGVPFVRSTAGWSEVSIFYQARIGQMPIVPGAITEWLFNGPTFDGFEVAQCLLKEAKAKYDQFFDAYGYKKDFWQGDKALISQAAVQSVVVRAAPPARLRWYFMESSSYSYFTKILTAIDPLIETEFHP